MCAAASEISMVCILNSMNHLCTWTPTTVHQVGSTELLFEFIGHSFLMHSPFFYLLPATARAPEGIRPTPFTWSLRGLDFHAGVSTGGKEAPDNLPVH